MVKNIQRYISKELTHFVGKGLNRASQYKLLIKILKEGCLTHPPHNIHQSGNLVIRSGARISKNEMYSPQMVCFCDIPLEDLEIHVKKYSSFGISFDKNHIIKKCGAPVYYMPIKSKVREIIDLTPEQKMELAKDGDVESLYKKIDKGEYFDTILPKYHKLFQLLRILIFEEFKGRQHKPEGALVDSIWNYPMDSEGYPIFDFPKNATRDFQSKVRKNSVRSPMWLDQQLHQLQMFLEFHVFSYIKFFDHNYPDNHIENYYFEREWRVIGNIKFSIEDVMRILIPQNYAKRFRKDCPEYYGQITFLD